MGSFIPGSVWSFELTQPQTTTEVLFHIGRAFLFWFLIGLLVSIIVWIYLRLRSLANFLMPAATNTYDAVFPISTSAQTRTLRDQRRDLIKENARLQTELRKSREDVEDFKTKHDSLLQENSRLERGLRKCNKKIRSSHGKEKRLYQNLETLQAHIKWLDQELEREQEERDASERQVQSLQFELEEEGQLARGVMNFIMNARR